ncbi:hypothetical protein FOL47_007431 [Perkinsus chesapeaki]|uniref:Uncharacterized protein n=1 Tax=Perkinsus chesapeaki TaxID=330153 RepID=A0A7J6MVK7_PERCH|nr:hypothetical protein FOL47_007431 [Perkinsus chesapeaki]
MVTGGVPPLHDSLLRSGIHISRPIYEEGVSCPNISLPWFEDHWTCHGHDHWVTKGWMHPTIIARDPKWLGYTRLHVQLLDLTPSHHPHPKALWDAYYKIPKPHTGVEAIKDVFHRLPRIDPVNHQHDEFIFKNDLEDKPAAWVQFHKICPPPLEMHKYMLRVKPTNFEGEEMAAAPTGRIFFSATNYTYPQEGAAALMRHDYFDNGYDDYLVRDWMRPDEDILRRH